MQGSHLVRKPEAALMSRADAAKGSCAEVLMVG